jgi:hypothetical protein
MENKVHNAKAGTFITAGVIILLLAALLGWLVQGPGNPPGGLSKTPTPAKATPCPSTHCGTPGVATEVPTVPGPLITVVMPTPCPAADCGTPRPNPCPAAPCGTPAPVATVPAPLPTTAPTVAPTIAPPPIVTP